MIQSYGIIVLLSNNEVHTIVLRKLESNKKAHKYRN